LITWLIRSIEEISPLMNCKKGSVTGMICRRTPRNQNTDIEVRKVGNRAQVVHAGAVVQLVEHENLKSISEVMMRVTAVV
jgi:hypothetical protein